MRFWIGCTALAGLTLIGGCFGNGIDGVRDGESKPKTRPECAEYDVNYIYASRQALDGSDATVEKFTSNIWSMEPDGRMARPLTSLTAELADSDQPVQSPDGELIAYVSRRDIEGKDAPTPFLTTNIWVMNHDGADDRPVTRLKSMYTDSIRPVFSPDSARIYYMSRRPLDGKDQGDAASPYNLWSVNVDGTDERPVTQLTAPGAHVTEAVFSADGQRIFYVSQRALDGTNAAEESRSSNIWVMNADGSESRPLTRFTQGVNADGVALSPDGRWIAFRSTADPTVPAVPEEGAEEEESTPSIYPFNIWIMASDGTGMKPLTNITARGADSMAPVFSPNSGSVIFASWRDENGEDSSVWSASRNLWRVSIDGTKLEALSRFDNDVELISPVFSHEGTKLVYTSNRLLEQGGGVNPATNIWEMDLEDLLMSETGEEPRTTPLTEATAYAADLRSPAVSARCTRWVEVRIEN